MRILLLSPEVPWPPINGQRLVILHLARELSARHEITVLGFRWPEQEPVAIDGVEVLAMSPPSESLATRVAAYARGSLSGEPSAVSRLTPATCVEAGRLVRERSFDVAHLISAQLGGVRRCVSALPAIIGVEAWHLNVAAARELDSPLIRPLRSYEERRVRRYTGHQLARFERLVVVTAQDAAALRGLDSRLDPVVIPNGVDTSEFVPGGGDGEPGHLMFTGALAYPPNVTAARVLAERIFPLVRAEVPDARLTLVGRTPSRTVRELARLDGVSVVADVPDMREWLWRARVYVCPMVSGTGIKNKLLEALACGRPAVATTLACQGTTVKSGRELLVADGEQNLAREAVRLLRDAGLRERLRDAGRAYVVGGHSWARVAEAYEEVYGQAIARRRVAAA